MPPSPPSTTVEPKYENTSTGIIYAFTADPGNNYDLTITYPAGDGTALTAKTIPAAKILTTNGGTISAMGGPGSGGAFYVVPPTITGTIDIAGAPLTGTATIYVGGTATLDTSVPSLAGYTVQVDGGSLTASTSAAGTLGGLVVSLDNGATFNTGTTSLSALRGMTVDFGTNGGTFIVGSSTSPVDLAGVTLNGFSAGTDKIEFANLSSAFNHYSIADNGTASQTVTLYSANGTTLGSFTVPGNALTNTSLSATISGDSVTLSDPPPAPTCFLAGTSIRTPEGEMHVDALKAGDLILTADGRAVPVRWVGAKKIPSNTANRAQVMPICIEAGALADNVPSRDLYVSPDHSMYLDGMLVPAQYLLNGVSITQRDHAGAILYYHVETDPHEIIIAENAATESYLDTGSRTSFMKSSVVSLYSSEEPKTWEEGCAPLLLSGPELTALQTRLAARAAQRPNLSEVA